MQVYPLQRRRTILMVVEPDSRGATARRRPRPALSPGQQTRLLYQQGLDPRGVPEPLPRSYPQSLKVFRKLLRFIPVVNYIQTAYEVYRFYNSVRWAIKMYEFLGPWELYAQRDLPPPPWLQEGKFHAQRSGFTSELNFPAQGNLVLNHNNIAVNAGMPDFGTAPVPSGHNYLQEWKRTSSPPSPYGKLVRMWTRKVATGEVPVPSFQPRTIPVPMVSNVADIRYTPDIRIVEQEGVIVPDPHFLPDPLETGFKEAPMPWRLIPMASRNLPYRAPSERSLRGYGPVRNFEQKPEISEVISENPFIDIPIARDPAVDRVYRFRPRRPARAREKEQKVKVRRSVLMRLLNKAIGSVTEGLDMVDPLYYSIHARHRYWLRNPSMQIKLEVIYENFEYIDWEKAAIALAQNQIEDYIWGKIGQKQGEAAARAGRLMGYQVGPLL